MKVNKQKKTKQSPKQKRNRRRVQKRIENKNFLFRRSMFFAICVFVLYQFIVIPLRLRQYSFFWMVSLFGFCVIIILLLYSGVKEYYRSIETGLKHVRKKIWVERVIHHLVLPTLLYFSGVFFLFFNNIRVLDQMAIIILTGTFGILLYNISTTHLKLYTVSRRTLYIYDFINIIIFYFVVDVLINSVLYRGGGITSICVGTCTIGLLLIGMMVAIARQFSKTTVVTMLISCITIGFLTYLILLVPVFSVSVSSLVVTVIFYLIDVYFHHKLDGSYNLDVMSQYLLFAIMSIILLLYL